MSDRLAVMNDGEFEQVGPPGDVYDRPETRFVADFIGTANIFDGSVTSLEDGYATVDCGDVTVTSATRERVSVDDDVSVVVRPERFDFEPVSPDGDADGPVRNVFEGEVTFRRHLGSSVEYRVETPDAREIIVVRQSGTDEHVAGDRVTVSADAGDHQLVLT